MVRRPVPFPPGQTPFYFKKREPSGGGMKIDEFISHWGRDSSTGLFLPKRSKQRLRKPAVKQSAVSRAQDFSDAFNRVTADPRIYAAIQEKIFDALRGWALFKMGG